MDGVDWSIPGLIVGIFTFITSWWGPIVFRRTWARITSTLGLVLCLLFVASPASLLVATERISAPITKRMQATIKEITPSTTTAPSKAGSRP